MRENGKTGSRPSRLVGNFPHFHAPAFTQRSHRNLGPVDLSQDSRFSLIARDVRADDFLLLIDISSDHVILSRYHFWIVGINLQVFIAS